MLGLSWAELGVVALVALLVLRPEDLPELIRKLVRGWRSARDMVEEVAAPIREIAREAEPLTRIRGEDGNWYETYASKEKLNQLPKDERI